jgi:pilus assembly protein Flp/PilA
MGMTMQKLFRVTSFIGGQTKCLARDESGATAIEYAMIAMSIAVAIIAAVNSLGTATNTMYTSVQTALK